MLKKLSKKLKREYILLGIILLLGLFVRVYRIDKILGFYFDQGRDAQVIWDLFHKGKFFLIGPTTGIEGIFRGPWYYWLIAPFYFLGNGNPVWPSVFLSLTTIVSAFLAYKIGEEISGKTAGIMAAVITSFSYYLVYASRWLSNPTPMLLISMSLIYSMLLAMKKKWWAFPLIGFLVGQAMQFGSAAEVFYIPAVFIFLLSQRKKLNLKILLLFGVAFIIPFLPQIMFDFKHQHILFNNIKKFLFEEESFKMSFWEIIKIRLPFYYDVFTSKIWPGEGKLLQPFLILAVFALVAKFKELWQKKGFRILLLMFFSPLIGMLFFQGNYGNVYDYYFTGYYLIFVLIFSILLSVLSKNTLWKIVLFLFFFFFLGINLPLVRNYIIAGTDGPTTIALENQKQAIDWIYKDAEGKEFNVDVYVPPVIPHAYNYLFTWLGTTKYNQLPKEENISLLFTLYEEDPPHPERLEAWMKRQKGIGKIIKEEKFGGITVQRRTRL
jgi:4-amino-4-deoxy-L-arabinose transferase-like glycosyltransferase